MAEPRSILCEWWQDAVNPSLWHSQCEHRLWLGQTGSPLENEMEYCCFCGLGLTEEEGDEDD